MNNVKSLFDPDHEKFSSQQTLTLIGLAALAAIVISVVPLINILDYPFRLLLTIVHELGHGLAAIVTGGDFHTFTIRGDGSGLALTAGGWRFAVIPAGYLGVALFAALLISLGRSHRWSRLALGLIGAMMLIMSCWYGRPGQLANILGFFNSVLTILAGVIFGVIFLRVALKATPATIIFFIHLIAIKAGLTAFSDIIGLVGLSTRLSAPHTDAHAMAELTHLPAVFWAVAWVGMAGLIIGWTIWGTWLAKD